MPADEVRQATCARCRGELTPQSGGQIDGVGRVLFSIPEAGEGNGPVVFFNRDQFQRWYTVTGRKVTLDVDCKVGAGYTGRRCPDFSPRAEPLAGNHMWMDIAPSKLFKALTVYKEQKALAPKTTSLVVVVPRWKGGSPWRKLMQGMRLLHEYPSGTLLYKNPETGAAVEGDNFPRQVWYDPCEGADGKLPGEIVEPWNISDDGPRQRTLLVLSTLPKDGLLMKYRGTIYGTPVLVLMDSGATGNFATKKAVNGNGTIEIKKVANMEVTGAGGKVKIIGRCTPRLEFRDPDKPNIRVHRTSPVIHVLDTLPGNFDVILGNEWLRANKAELDFDSGTCRLRHARPPVLLRVDTSGAKEGKTILEADDLVSSGVQLKEPGKISGSGRKSPRATRCTGSKKVKLKIKALVPKKVSAAAKRKEKPISAAQVKNKHINCLMSLMDFKRTARKAARLFILMVLEDKMEEKDPLATVPPEIRAVVEQYGDVFAPIPAGLPPDRGVSHTIPLIEGAAPPYKKMYRLSPKEKQEVEDQVKELLEKGWIEPSTSPYGAPVIFAPKKDGTLRMCVDYRALNLITVKNRYPLPRIDDLLDKLHGATMFTSLDLQSGYHQIRITDEDGPKTAFLTHMGLYQYKVLCFGISNAPSTFQAVMNKALAPVLGKTAMVYMDDILIFSKNAADHAQHVAQVLQLLRENQLYAKMGKCSFAQVETVFLGHVISAKGIQVDPKKIKVIMKWPTPNSVERVRSFLGLATYFRKFCKDFSTKAHPLHKLTRKTESWRWDKEQEEAFQLLRTTLATAPVLSPPNLELGAPPFHVICDASMVGLGAVLEQDGHPVAFESRKLSKAEANYHVGEQELLAVVHAMRTWRCYLEGVKSVVVTDHNPLTYLQKQPCLSRRQVRWSGYLQNFDFTWKYRPGVTNPADSLSRVPAFMLYTELIEAELECVDPFLLYCAIDEFWRSGLGCPKEGKKEQSEWIRQPPAKDMLGCLAMMVTTRSQTMGERLQSRKAAAPVPVAAEPTADDPDEPAVRPAVTQATIKERCRRGYKNDPWYDEPNNFVHFEQRDGLYYNENRLAVPMAGTLRMDIIAEEHDTPYGGHGGTLRTTEKIQRLFWWPTLRVDVKTFVQTCHMCQRNKASRQRPAGQLQSLPIPERRWGDVSLDFITKLPPTDSGNTQIVVYVCRLTKMVHLSALSTNVTAEDVARDFIHNVFRLHGLPERLVSDRDSKFTSDFWKECMRILGTTRCMTTAYHPQADGQVERTNQVIEDMMRHWINPQQTNWDTLLDCAEFAMNNSISATTQNTPFRLNYGQDPLTPLSIEADTRLPVVRSFVREMTESLRSAKRCMQAAQGRQQTYYNEHRRPQEFRVGQRVWLKTTNFTFKGAKDKARKLFPKWAGPYLVVEPVGRLAYRLQLPAHFKCMMCSTPSC